LESLAVGGGKVKMKGLLTSAPDHIPCLVYQMSFRVVLTRRSWSAFVVRSRPVSSLLWETTVIYLIK